LAGIPSKLGTHRQLPPMGWFNHPNTFFFGLFFYLKIYICDGGILEKKNVKVVELPQFESL
jgi:hypothetical protein